MGNQENSDETLEEISKETLEVQAESKDGNDDFEIIDLQKVADEEHHHHRHYSKSGHHRSHSGSHKSNAHHSSSGHHKHRHHKKKLKWWKVLLIILGVIASLVVASAIVIAVMIGKGKAGLYERSKGKTANIQSDNSVDESDGIKMKDNWITHKGKIYEYNDEILTFYVMGIDKKSVDDDSAITMGQSDANFLITLNPKTKEMNVIAINRDTMIDLVVYDYGGSYVETRRGQLALQHAYGRNDVESAEHQMNAISQLFYGIPINGYVSLKLESIPVINDSVGGVTVTCNEDLTEKNSQLYEGATVNLVGNMAYDFVQERTKTYEGARRRLERQKIYIKSFVETAKTEIKGGNLTLIYDLYNALSSYMCTNLTVDQAAYLASIAKDYKFDMNNIRSLEGETVQGERYEEFNVDDEYLQDLIVEIFYSEVDTK
ncbi:MAG: LCP family protein [Lachnospiraceae bacterium]|nr:LCP family protein [Lachnospiraceae bacterium]